MTQVIGSFDEEMSLWADDLYFQAARQIALLSREEEAVLLERVAAGKQEQMVACPDGRVLAEAKAARDRLVEGFQGLVIASAERAKSQGFVSLEVMDLVQEGNVGLLQAIDRYNPALGYPLVALASVCIRHALTAAWQQRDGYIKLWPADVRDLGNIRRMQERFVAEHGYLPSVQQVAQELGLQEPRVFDLFAARRCRQGQSIQGRSERYEMDEDTVPMISLFATSEVAVTSVERCEQLRQVIETQLTPLQRQVIAARFGLDDDSNGRLWREVAEQVGVTVKCAKTAARAARRKLARVLVNGEELPVVSALVSPVASCAECGKDLSGLPQKVGRKYCSTRCYRLANYRRDRERAAAALGLPVPLPVVACAECGGEMPNKAGRKYCSKQCYRVANHRQDRER
jgi:RNA polymerase primary sigma factor